MLTLGIDIGTYESKGVLVDARGRVLAEAQRRHEMIVPRPGWAEHRAEEDWWGDFTFISKALLAKAEVASQEVGAVACSGIGPCMLPLDAAGKPLMPAVLYGVDTRASAQIAQLNATLGEARILAHGGNALTSQAVGPKILWLRQTRPEIWEKTDKITTSTSYLTWRLTGEHVIDHYTAASFAPLYDIEAQAWDPLGDICPASMLPRLAWASDIIGHVTPQAARESGLAAGTPVLCGTIDAAAEAVSVGVAEPGQMMMMYGSTVFTIAVTGERQAEPRLWHAPWLYPGRHAVMGGLATSGTLTHWFRDQFARELDRDTAFAALTQEAARSPKGARGLICLPYFSGERVPHHDPSARGLFFGLDLTHGRGDLYRAVLEGIAAATADVLAAHATPPRVLRAVGGGTRNPVWLQATSDMTGLAQEVTQVTLGASYGDAWMAARALGTAPEITEWNPVVARISPERVAAYDRQLPVFRALYGRTRDLMAELARGL